MHKTMSVADRRAREREELRQKILDKARELFIAHGYEGVTLRKIANAIEYAPGTIYSYFKDKDELLRALCVADWESFEQNFPRSFEPSKPLDALRAIGTSYIRFALENPNQYRLMFMTPKPPAMKELDDEILAKKGDPARDGYALLRQVVQMAIDAELLRERFRDAEVVAQTLWAGVHGMASLEIAMGCDPWLEWAPREERITAIVDALLWGLVADEAERA
jgi:AcrR family transcriptional regulator